MPDSSNSLLVFKRDDLFEFGKSCFIKIGMLPKDAELVADHLLAANLRGVDSHGVIRIPYYVEGFEKGYVNPRSEIRVLRECLNTAILDGGRALGIVAAARASEMAARKALGSGVALVGAVNIGHVGMLGYYTGKIAEEGLVGLALANGVAEMAPWGGISKVFGTNPISMSIPQRAGAPIIIDMATSAVAKFKLHLALAKSEKLPEGVALDNEGRPTRDPAEALRGCLLPFGGHKGYSLALFVEIMASALIGGPKSVEVKEHPSQQGGFLVAAIDPDVLGGREQFLTRVEEIVKVVKSARKAEGFEEILLPGEPEEKTFRERREKGVPLDPGTVQKLAQLSERLEIPLPKPLS